MTVWVGGWVGVESDPPFFFFVFLLLLLLLLLLLPLLTDHLAQVGVRADHVRQLSCAQMRQKSVLKALLRTAVSYLTVIHQALSQAHGQLFVQVLCALLCIQEA